MRVLIAHIAVFVLLAAACSSGSVDSADQGVAAPTASTVATETSSAPSTAGPSAATNTTLITAADGGIVSFGESIQLIVPPGALSADTEIGIESVPVSDWPDVLSQVEGVDVVGEVLRFSPDGLKFNEPAVLTRRVDQVVAIEDGLIEIPTMLSANLSDGEWTSGAPDILISDGEILAESSITHFSRNALLSERDKKSVSVRLTPGLVQRQVGHHFIADLTVTASGSGLATPTYTPSELLPDFWRVDFFSASSRSVEIFSNPFDLNSNPIERLSKFIDRMSDPTEALSSPLVSGMPSSYLVESRGPDLGLVTPTPDDFGPSVLIASERTPNPGTFPASFICTAEGKARFGAAFGFMVKPSRSPWRGTLNQTDADGGEYIISGEVTGDANCVSGPEDLVVGIYEIESSVASDPAGHSCCLEPPARRARMTLGSLWFTDTKLGGSTEWQGIFFDASPGGVDDVINPVNDAASNPPSTVQIAKADDFDQTGHFTADGVGTVAGFPGIRVVLDAVADDQGTWSGTLTKGVDGGLPTGQPIIYDIQGTLVAPQPVAFVDELASAFRSGDSEFLLEHLHPGVLRRYGPACVDFVNTITSPDLSIAVRSFAEIGDWVVDLDGDELSVADAITLDVTRTEDGKDQITTMHIAPRPSDGMPSEMTWFADCGDPFPVG